MAAIMTHPGRPAPPAPDAAARIPWVLLVTLLLGTFTGALNTTVVAPALLSIGEAFTVSQRDLSWLFTIYVLANIVSLPLMAKLSDLYGRRTIYLTCIGLFATGSVAAAFAPTFEFLLAARAIQALGGGGVGPVASATIGDVFPRSRQGFALGLTGTVWSVASIVGPLLGGVIVAGWNWQGVFLLNLPVALAVFILAWRLLPDRRPAVARPFDLAGLILLASGLVLVVSAISRLDPARPALGMATPEGGGALAGGLLVLAVWAWWERRVEAPIVDLRLLRQRQLAVAYFLSALGGMGMISRLYVPAFLESTQGVDPATAGFLTALGAGGVMASTPVGGIAIDRFGPKAVLLAGGTLSAGGMALMAAFSSSFPVVFAGLMLSSLGIGLITGAPLRYIVLGEAPPDQRGIASGVLQISSSVGSAVAIAFTGAVLSAAAAPAEGFVWVYAAYAGFAVLALAITALLRGRRQARPEGTTSPPHVLTTAR